jgi:hypothetical protein
MGRIRSCPYCAAVLGTAFPGYTASVLAVILDAGTLLLVDSVGALAANDCREDALTAWRNEPEGAASRGRLIPFGRVPGAGRSTRVGSV